MRRMLLPALALVSVVWTPLSLAAAEGSQHHALVLAGLECQPILRVKVSAAEIGGRLTTVVCSTRGTERVADIVGARLFSTGSAASFLPHGPQPPREVAKAAPQPDGTITFACDVPVAGEQYLWLTYDLAATAQGDAAIDGAWVGLHGPSGLPPVVPSSPDPAGAAKVFPFVHRTIPYYRFGHLVKWRPDHLQPAHFDLITDIIGFCVGCNADGTIEGAADPETVAALEKVRTLKGTKPVNLLLGVGHVAKTLPAVVADPSRRGRYAQALVDFAVRHGLQGIDIDWEYPENDRDWEHFGLLLQDLRERCFAPGLTLSCAVEVSYKPPPAAVCDQLDFVSLMAYDAQGEHSTFAFMERQVNIARKMGIPDARIVVGLPFYSNEIEQRNWDAQMGWDSIVGVLPQMKPGDNTFTDPRSGKRHFFNGPDLIRQKAAYVKDQKLGGCMIWAYDTDVSLGHPLSLAALLGEVLRPVRR